MIAFIISDFKAKQTVENGFTQRVFAAPNQFENGGFALENGHKILKAIADYLNVRYTLPKMDQAAIPDFRAGGKFISLQHNDRLLLN